MDAVAPDNSSRVIEGEVYASHQLGGASVSLCCDLYLPSVPSPPLFVWFHGGAFVTGNFRQRVCRRMGRVLTKHGIAVASVQYRLKAEFDDLSEAVQMQYDALQAKRRNHLRLLLSHDRALAAMEDGLAFVRWANDNADRFGWSDTRILAGTSAGGINAFNMVFTAPALGIECSKPAGVFSASGGYAYPSLVSPELSGPILAIHNPEDKRVPIKSVRRMKRVMGKQVRLIESDTMIHSHITPFPDERRFATFKRIADFVHSARDNSK
ncbi:alpha/beta hydrolase [Roseovarius phycicola]|uniref:Alpha/beta hydrolase n=1 Tax=Roseovarius phycicola TaxID=3080976 RepID=A0ABZ2HNJ4_9RHOB